MPSGETLLTLSLGLDKHFSDRRGSNIKYGPQSKGLASAHVSGAKISNSNLRTPGGNKTTIFSVVTLCLNPQYQSSLLSCVNCRCKREVLRKYKYYWIIFDSHTCSTRCKKWSCMHVPKINAGFPHWVLNLKMVTTSTTVALQGTWFSPFCIYSPLQLYTNVINMYFCICMFISN